MRIIRWWIRLRTSASAFFSSAPGQRLLRVVRVLITLGIVAFLLVQLTRIGWGEVIAALPRTPWFYVLWLLIYATLPISEMLVYGRLWKAHPVGIFFASLRKRVLNNDVMGYSGEVYLYMWARGRLSAPSKRIWRVIKDNLIVSSLTSIATAVLVLGGLLLTGQITLDRWVDETMWWYIAIGGVIAVLLSALLIQFRRVVFSLPAPIIGWMTSIHTARYLIAYALQVVLWWTVVPDASFEAWAILLAVLILTYRIPLIPSRDLLFVSVSVELYAVVGVGQAVLAGMLLAQSVLEKVANAVLFAATTLWERRQRRQQILADGRAEIEVPPPEEPVPTE